MKKPVLIACVSLLTAATVFAGGSNSIPYFESFEGYSEGFAITNANGWYCPDGEPAAYVTNEPDHGLRSPYCPREPHTKALCIPGALFFLGCYFVFGSLEHLHGATASERTFLGVIPMLTSLNLTIQLLRGARLKRRLRNVAGSQQRGDER